MSKKNTAIKTLCCLIISSNYIMNANAENIGYVMPSKNMHCSEDANGNINCDLAEEMTDDMVKCVNKNKLVYCANQNNEPITGEVVKYENGAIRRRYTFKDGYLDGVGKAYDKNGYETAEISYSQGIVNGNTATFSRDGEFSTRTPYNNGVKEGIAEFSNKDVTVKSIYIDDALNGSTQIWYNKTKKKIYDLEMSSDYISNGTYHYYSNPDGSCCNYTGKEDVDTGNFEEKEITIPKILIDAINVGCAEVQEKFSCSPYPAFLMATEEDCKDWIKIHQKELKEVQEKIRCK